MSLHIAFLLLAAAPAAGAEDLDAAVAALEAQKNWNEASRQKAEVITKRRIDQWGTCVRSRGSEARLQYSTEAADTVATRVLEGCQKEEADYRRALTLSYRGRFAPTAGAQLAAKSVLTARNKARNEIVATLAAERHSAP